MISIAGRIHEKLLQLVTIIPKDQHHFLDAIFEMTRYLARRSTTGDQMALNVLREVERLLLKGEADHASIHGVTSGGNSDHGNYGEGK